MSQTMGRDEAAKVFYSALENYLEPESGFDALEGALMHVASERFGSPSPNYQAVRDSLDAVGLSESWRDPSLSCGCAIGVGLTGVDPSGEGLATYYRAREELLPASTGGALLETIYEVNSDRIADALLADADLRAQAGEVFNTLAPGLTDLMDGDGSQTFVSAADVSRVDTFLRALSQADDDSGVPAPLSSYIDAGLADLAASNAPESNPLAAYEGLTYAEAWARLNERLCDDALFSCASLPEDGQAPALRGRNVMRPNGDTTPDPTVWNVVGTQSPANPWPAINEPAMEPTAPPMNDYLTTSAANAYTSVWLGGGPKLFYADVPVNGKLWYYASTGASASLKTTVWPTASQTLGPNAPLAWRAIPFTPTAPYASQLGSLSVSFMGNPGTELVRPNADRYSEWSYEGGGSAWGLLDDAVKQPTLPPSSDLIVSTAKDQAVRVAFPNPALPAHHVSSSSGTLWFYGHTNEATKLEANAYWGGVLRASRTIAKGQPYAWRSLSVPLPNQAALDDLEVRFRSVEGAVARVRAAYVGLPIPTGPTTVHAAYYEFFLP